MPIKKIILIIILLATAAQAAEWVEVSLKYNWDKSYSGFCKTTAQCLVKDSNNESLDNMPEKYWTGTSDSTRPKCITDKQYILDYYCENGQWSSRTKLIAQQLLAIAGTTDYAIYCDNYQKVLNEYQYTTDYGTVTSFLAKFCLQGGQRNENCANNICVIKYGNNAAFGMAINTNISGDKSPLQALNLSKNQCNQALNQQGYTACGNNVYYNPQTESIIYAKNILNMPPVTQTQTDLIKNGYEKLKDYTMTYAHRPTAGRDYSFYETTPLFNYIYLAKDTDKNYYSFKHEIKQNLLSLNYSGWYYYNIQLPEEACDRYIKTYDSRAICEQQPSDTEFYIIAKKKQGETGRSIIDAWQDMTGKLRIYK